MKFTAEPSVTAEILFLYELLEKIADCDYPNFLENGKVLNFRLGKVSERRFSVLGGIKTECVPG